jgi:hypothetical protein
VTERFGRIDVPGASWSPSTGRATHGFISAPETGFSTHLGQLLKHPALAARGGR